MNETQANDRVGRQTDATTNSLKYLIAFLRMSVKDKVAPRLRDRGVTRFSVATVKTYGEYKNFFASDLFGEQDGSTRCCPRAEPTRSLARSSTWRALVRPAIAS
jgi:hypothetical protein